MKADIRRAGAFFFVGTLSLIAPALETEIGSTLATIGTVLSFGLVAAVALSTTHGVGFELFARDGDRIEGRLFGLAGFALASAALGILVLAIDLPSVAFVVSIFVLTTGNLAGTAATRRRPDPAVVTSAFVLAGTVGGVAAALVTEWLGGTVLSFPLVLFVATSGALLAALVRSALFARDDALVVVLIGLVTWLLLWLETDPTFQIVGTGVGLAVLLGAAAYRIGTASVTGTLSGILFALLAFVLGGIGWFVLLVTFFGLGSLASKYRYEEKRDRGLAQGNEGARGGANVMANSAVAILAVVGFAASGEIGLSPEVFELAFAGGVAAALADTFSSEFGGLFRNPRLITNLEPVPPGTDGGVTWQGVVAGFVGAGTIAVLMAPFFSLSWLAIGVVVLAGFLGTIVDSLLGATLEGQTLTNQTVNLLATLVAALVAGSATILL